MNYSKKEISKKQKTVRSKKKKMKKKMSVIFLKAFLVCMIAVGVVVACAGVGIIKGVIDNAPDITSESVIPKGYKSTVYDSEGNKMQELIASGTNRTMVTLDQIPKYVQQAFIAIEDERFYEHNGIDIQGILRAGVKFVTSGFRTTQGASTITQQLLKNNVFDFMSEEGIADKVERKIQEQYLAVKLEETMSKDEILQAYLNTINLGQNTLGIQAASERYFGKNVEELTLAEAAVLAGITKSPEGYNPIKNQTENAKRQKLVLGNMLEQNMISQEEYEAALAEDVYSKIKNVNENVQSNLKVNSYFTDAVVKSVLSDLKELKGYSDTQAYNMLYGGGLKIHTTLDPQIQQIMDEEIANPDNFPGNYKIGLEYAMTTVKPDGTTTNYSKQMMQKYFREKTGKKSYDLLFNSEEEAQAAIDEYEATVIEEGDTVYRNIDMTIQPQIAMVVMDQYTGEIKGIIGGRGEKTANLTLNRTTDAIRQPGSTFKMVAVYAPAFDAAGMTLATTQYDGPYLYEEGSDHRLVKNVVNTYKGWTSLRYGIEQSTNILAVKTYTENGSALGLTYLDKFGFSTIQKEPDENGRNDYGPAVALGGLTNGVSDVELTAAYAAFANKGVYQEPIFYTKIEDMEGNVIIDKTKSRETHEAVSEETAWLLTQAMKDVVTKGTGKAVNFGGMTIAGKTGTTTDDKDVWFAGYTPYYTAGVWAGYDEPTKLAKNEKGYHKQLWKAVMSRIHKELGLENKDFEKPDGIVTAQVCSESGKLAVPGLCDCDPRGNMVVTEYFAKGTVPTESCNIHVRAKICMDTGLLATDRCAWPAEQVRVILPVLQEGAPNISTADTPYGVQMAPEATCSVCSGGEILQSLTVTEYYTQMQGITSARKK